jgi:TonB family protein
MSAAPQLHHPSDTDSLLRAYNSAAADERPLEAAAMTGTWKRWEGQVVDGKFPLQRFLGGSDHSAVFLTQRSSEKAAIKLIAADPDNAEAQLSRWRLAARLSDPQLLRIFDMGRTRLDDTDLLYLVMELADDDLSQILPQRVLTPHEAQEMLKPVLRSLAYIHGEHCVHGRVRPSNILAVGDQVELSSDSLSASGETARREGSVYDAPESASGAIPPAADVWSLGVMIVEVLTQRLPDPMQSGHAVLPAGMPPLFQDIARRCLHADPQQRWTIAQIAARLEPASTATPKALASALATARLATPIERTPVPADKKASAKWLYVVPVVAAGAVAWMLISGSMSGPKTKAPNPPDRPVPGEQRQAQPTNYPQPSRAKPEARPKPSPAQSRKMQEAGNSTTAAAPVAAATTPKPEAVPALNASTAPGGTAGVVHTVMPVVSQGARNTIQGRVKVRVRVHVDTSGNVVSAVLDSPGPSRYFARLALEAAQGWKFTPAQAHGQFVPSEWTLRFAFTRSDTEVVPAQTAP